MAKNRSGIPTLAYMGVEASSPPNITKHTTAPSTVDKALVRTGYYNINVCDMWLKYDDSNPASPDCELWMQVDKDKSTGTRLARWIQLYPHEDVAIHRTDGGDAVPAGGILNVIGAGGVTTSGAGNTVTITGSATLTPGTNINIVGTAINLDSSIQQPITNAAGTEGVYAVGSTGLPGGYITDRFLHSYGTENTFLGNQSGQIGGALTGESNVGLGFHSLTALTSGDDNFAGGSESGNALTSGAGNVLLGTLAGSNYTTEDNNVNLASTGTVADSGIIRIGTNVTHTQSYMQGIWQNSPAAPEFVIVDSAGCLGSQTVGPSVMVVTIYTANDTWTKAVGANFIEVIAWNGGNGGGGGGCSTSATTGGGGGGGTGGGFHYRAPALFFGATEAVVVGAGGAGGAGGLSAPGSPGIVGGDSSFGVLTTVNSGTGGGGGDFNVKGTVGNSAPFYGGAVGRVITFNAANNNDEIGTGGLGEYIAGTDGHHAGGSGNIWGQATPGGGGGGFRNTGGTAFYAGGNGGEYLGFDGATVLKAGGAGGGALGIDGSPGITYGVLSGILHGGTGGGGGASGNTTAGDAGDGGAGAIPSGGGGGGGATAGTVRGGGGGAGARGEIWVIEWL